MSNIIQHKRSSTPGAIPTTGVLDYAEIAINYSDGKIYTKNNSDNIINLAASSISGVNINPGLITTNSGITLINNTATIRLHALLGGELDNSDIYFETDSESPLHVAYKESTTYIGTTAITLNRSSASQTLSGVSIDGNAATVTSGVYTTGNQSISGIKTFKNRMISDSGPYIQYNLLSNEGNIHLSNSNANYISFSSNGNGIPSVFSRSSGTKILLSPAPAQYTADTAIGVNSGNMWFTIPNTTYNTKWYAGQGEIATLTGSGVFTVAGATSQINVDNLRLDGNTVSSTNNGGHILLMPNGNIGINTTSPTAYKLTVNGNFRAHSINTDDIVISQYFSTGGFGLDGFFSVFDASEEVIMEASIDEVYCGVPLTTTSYISFFPETSASLTSNGQVKFERVSNTGLKIKMRGTDGVTRSITLALS